MVYSIEAKSKVTAFVSKPRVTLAGAEEMRELMHDVCADQLLEAETIAGVKSNPDDWRYRTRTALYPIHSWVGAVSRSHFKNVICALFHDALHGLKETSPLGEWRLAGYSLYIEDAVEVWKRTKTETAKWSVFDDKPSPQHTEFYDQPVEQFVLKLAFVDLLQNTEADEAAENPKRTAMLSAYIKSGDWRKLPKNMREERTKAIELIALDVPGSQKEADENEGIPLGKVETAQKLREKGVSWRDLGTLLDIDPKELKAAVEPKRKVSRASKGS